MVATAGKQFFGNNAVISIVDGNNTIEVGIAQSATMTFTTDDVKLYGCGDVMWQDVGRTNGNVEVNLNYAKIVPITSDIAVRTLDGDGPNSGTITIDTTSTTYPKFEVTMVITSTDGGTTRTYTASNVYFPNYTWELAYGEFSTQTLEGHGNALTIEESTV